MKNPVAPIVCAVQFMSPPSEMVEVDTPKEMHDTIERGPNEFNESVAEPRISKLLISR